MRSSLQQLQHFTFCQCFCWGRLLHAVLRIVQLINKMHLKSPPPPPPILYKSRLHINQACMSGHDLRSFVSISLQWRSIEKPRTGRTGRAKISNTPPHGCGINVKVKLTLCLTRFYAMKRILCLIKLHAMIMHRGVVVCPHILNLGIRSASRPGYFTLGERAPDTLWIKGWIGPRAGLDVMAKRKENPFTALAGSRTPVVHSAS
jgi:hypothetical protein